MRSKLSPEIRLKIAFELAFSPDGSRVAYIGRRGVTMLDLGSRETQFTVHPVANPSHIDFSPDGHFLVVKSTSGQTVVLEAQTGRMLSDFRNQEEREGGSALFTACSGFVVSVSWRGLFSVRERESGKAAFLQSHEDCMLTLLSSTADRNLFVYSIGRRPRSPDGVMLHTIVLHRWSARSMSVEHLPKEWDIISGLQVSPSGRFIAVVHDTYGTPSATLEIYDIEHSHTVAQCPWSGSPGCSIAWSSDERTLVTNGDDCFRVYALPELQVVLDLPSQYPCFTRFSSSDKFIALGSWSQSFVVPTENLSEFASRRKA